mgnify:CR=1 FL=1
MGVRATAATDAMRVRMREHVARQLRVLVEGRVLNSPHGYLVDGSTLVGVDIESEKITGVTFKQKGKSELQTVEPDKVLSIEYKRLPSLIDEAEGLARDGAIEDAIVRYNEFV